MSTLRDKGEWKKGGGRRGVGYLAHRGGKLNTKEKKEVRANNRKEPQRRQFEKGGGGRQGWEERVFKIHRKHILRLFRAKETRIVSNGTRVA